MNVNAVTPLNHSFHPATHSVSPSSSSLTCVPSTPPRCEVKICPVQAEITAKMQEQYNQCVCSPVIVSSVTLTDEQLNQAQRVAQVASQAATNLIDSFGAKHFNSNDQAQRTTALISHILITVTEINQSKAALRVQPSDDEKSHSPIQGKYYLYGQHL